MLIVGGNQSAGGYEVDNSLRFDRASSDYLNITYGSAGNRKTMTFSFWIKRGKLSTTEYPMSIFDSGTGFQADMRFSTTDIFRMYSTDTSGTPALFLVTNRLFRDTSAWYHMVWEIDTTQATASDRVKLYVNGVQETSFSTETYPAQNIDLRWNGTSGSTGGVTNIGAINGGNSIDGYMAEVVFIDGTALDATSFGEFDEDTGIWKPINVSGLTFGTNGFYLDFEDSAALGDDVSGNGNDFTVNNLTSIDQSTDTCTNNFATYNPLYKGNYTLSEGNLKSTISSGSDKFGGVSTFGVSSGKWYAEFKAQSASANLTTVGIFGNPQLASNNNQGVGKETNSISYVSDGQKYIENSASSYGASYTTNDIIGVALDLDSGTKTITFYKNGVSQGAITISLTPSDGVWFMASNSASAGATADWEANFGNGYFGTTAVSSAQSPSDGIGLFEYAVPSGYKALCTKSINSQEYS